VSRKIEPFDIEVYINTLKHHGGKLSPGEFKNRMMALKFTPHQFSLISIILMERGIVGLGKNLELELLKELDFDLNKVYL
jgi:hypothetical protein